MAPSSPLLDEYNRTGVVTPPLQRAMDLARQKLSTMNPGLDTPFAAPAAAAPGPQLSPPGSPTPSLSAPQQSAQPAAAAPTAAPTQTPVSPSPHQQDLTRLTTGPTSQSGINHIHNPWLRHPLQVLDAIGSAFVPSLMMGLPGTQLHHQMLVNSATRNVNQDEKQATEEATRQHLSAQTGLAESQAGEANARSGLAESQAGEANARAESLAHPPKDWAQSTEPEVDPAHPEIGPQSVWYNKSDPAKKQYGNAPVAAKPTEDKQQGTVHALPDGSVVSVNHDAKTGESTAKVIYKGDPKVQSHVITKPANVDHGQNYVDLDTGTLVRVPVGGKVPQNAELPTQVGPTMQMRNVGAQAALVHEQTPMMLSQIDRLKDKLGPMAGRWNEFMQGKVGMNDPNFAGLRADLLMYSSAVALMHARGRLPENLRAEFDNAINNPKQDFNNLKSIITRVDGWTQKNMKAMGAHGEGDATGGASAGVTEFTRDKEGKLVVKK